MYKHFVLPLLAGVFLCATPAAATPTACETASAAAYAQLSEGCTVGLFTLKNVAWSSVSGTGFVPVTASEVMIAPSVAGGAVRVAFYSDAFSVSGQNQIYALLDYTLDPPPPILDDLNVSIDAQSPVAPGLARVTANVCPGDLFRDSCSTVLPPIVLQHFGDSNPNNVLSQTVQFPQPVNLIDVRIVLELQANGASSQINGVIADTGTVSDVAAPEPASVLLFASAAVFGLVVRRKRR